MAVAYFDSSVLLSILLQETAWKASGILWEEYPKRVSSLLLNAECWTGIRRHFLRIGQLPPAGWMAERGAFLDSKLEEVTIKPMDMQTIARLKADPGLAECRTLDALHLATALECRERTGEDLVVITLDRRMRETAIKAGLKVLPAQGA